MGKRIYIGLFVLLVGLTAFASSQQSQPEWRKNMAEGDRYGHARMFRHALSCYEKAYEDPAIKDSVNIRLRLLKNLVDFYDITGNGKLLVQTNIAMRELAKANGQDAYVAMSDFMKGKHMHYQGSKDKGYALCLKSLELLKKAIVHRRKRNWLFSMVLWPVCILVMVFMQMPCKCRNWGKRLLARFNRQNRTDSALFTVLMPFARIC